MCCTTWPTSRSTRTRRGRRRGRHRPLAPPEDRAAQRRALRQPGQRRAGALQPAGLGGADAGQRQGRDGAHRGAGVAARRACVREEAARHEPCASSASDTPRRPDEGTRIGTVRRPPRGVPKSEFASRDFYDVWFPNLSPSPELVKRALASQADLSAAGEKEWAAFTRGYRAEMARARERACDRAAGDDVATVATSRWAATARTRRAAIGRSCARSCVTRARAWTTTDRDAAIRAGVRRRRAPRRARGHRAAVRGSPAIDMHARPTGRLAPPTAPAGPERMTNRLPRRAVPGHGRSRGLRRRGTGRRPPHSSLRSSTSRRCRTTDPAPCTGASALRPARARRLPAPPDVLVVDGYVWLLDESAPGLGARPHERHWRASAGGGASAKTAFRDALAAPRSPRCARRLGQAPVDGRRPRPGTAATCVRSMAGDHRMPLLLAAVDAWPDRALHRVQTTRGASSAAADAARSANSMSRPASRAVKRPRPPTRCSPRATPGSRRSADARGGSAWRCRSSSGPRCSTPASAARWPRG